MRRAQVAMVAGLLAVITVARILLEVPGYGIAFYAIIPIVLGGFWFGRQAAVLAAVTAALVDLVSEFIWPSQTLEGAGLWVAAVNRSVIYVGVALITTTLLQHERQLRTRVAQQQQRLTELESLRAALTPAQIPPRPGLELATALALSGWSASEVARLSSPEMRLCGDLGQGRRPRSKSRIWCASRAGTRLR